ncbi:hypothetical protein REC12_12510 [Desulfosporosinus sp. PR]|uniref:hypothetical protein n=1 Tax=Candidatus Desulfosporosinus nitrosoreducens TaxID=3401928 RepID=UPI0027F9385A|nr:hypothetical protein [Desulfosporosinus sp. PR]MDQ7094412.1 hypothetical protein [Desulfosporosinus sp. PR]
MRLKALVVDDDPNMRILKKILQNIPGIEVVGEAVNGAEAINLATLEPDVIFPK